MYKLKIAIQRGDGAFIAKGNHEPQVPFTFNRRNASLFVNEEAATYYIEWLLRHGCMNCDYYKPVDITAY